MARCRVLKLLMVWNVLNLFWIVQKTLSLWGHGSFFSSGKLAIIYLPSNTASSLFFQPSYSGISIKQIWKPKKCSPDFYYSWPFWLPTTPWTFYFYVAAKKYALYSAGVYPIHCKAYFNNYSVYFQGFTLIFLYLLFNNLWEFPSWLSS